MSKCRGLHCPGCGKGGGWLLLALAVVVIAAWIRKTAGKAISEAGHVLAVVLEVALITVASAAGIAVLAGLGWAGLKVRRRYTNRAAAAVSRPVYQAVVLPSQLQAIEPPRPQPAGVEDLLLARHSPPSDR